MSIPSIMSALRRQRGFVLLLALGVGLANVGKAVHIDDALYLAVARRIVTHPLDPYGGELNWQHVAEPTYKSSISPPLLSYYFAFVILAVGGEWEVALHLSMLPFFLLLGWALFQLGERLAGAGVSVASLVLLSPTVVVGSNLMLDVPMLALACASLEFALVGRDRPGANGPWVLAGVFCAAAVLVKYPALAALPVFLLIGVQKRSPGPFTAIVIVLGALVGWQTYSGYLYGSSQVGQSLKFLEKFRYEAVRLMVERTLSGLAILAMVFPIWIVSLMHGNRRPWTIPVAMGVAGLAAWLLKEKPPIPLALTCAFVAAVFLGAQSITHFIAGAFRHLGMRNGVLWILILWSAGFAGVAIALAPFVAARSFLPLEPALAILLFHAYPPGRRRTNAIRALMAAMTLLSIGLGVADWKWAASYKREALDLANAYTTGEKPVLFLGHWGWQHYAQKLGLVPFDARWGDLPRGSIVLIPSRVDKQFIRPSLKDDLERIESRPTPAGPLGLTTWNRSIGVQFYGGDFGAIPWGFSMEPQERFDVYRKR